MGNDLFQNDADSYRDLNSTYDASPDATTFFKANFERAIQLPFGQTSLNVMMPI